MKLTLIQTNSGEVHVHKAGCADIAKQLRKSRDAATYQFEATTKRGVIEDYWHDHIFENDGSDWTDYQSETRFAPCVDLPLDS